MGAGHGFTKSKRQNILNMFDGRCAYCGCRPTVPLTYDHILPRCKGGDNTYTNLLPACHDCNRCKGDLSLQDFRALVKIKLLADIETRGAWKRILPLYRISYKLFGEVHFHFEDHTKPINLTPDLPEQSTVEGMLPSSITEINKRGHIAVENTQALANHPKYASMGGWGFGANLV